MTDLRGRSRFNFRLDTVGSVNIKGSFGASAEK